MSTSVLLADDHQIVRQGLEALLRREPDLEVVGAATTGFEALELSRRRRPQVLVLDLSLPGIGGLEVIRQVREQQPEVRVVVLSMHAGDSYVLEALRQGAAAYVLKDSSSDELVLAIHEVVAGRRYLSPALSERAIAAYMEQASKEPGDPYESLTAREREVLCLVAEGRTSPEVAEALSISPRTAEMHRQHLMHKLGLTSQTDLIRYALRKGILPLDP